MKWLVKAWSEGKRKLVYGGAAFLAICGAAYPLKATFAEFKTAVLLWLGIQLTAHVTADKLGKAKAALEEGSK